MDRKILFGGAVEIHARHKKVGVTEILPLFRAVQSDELMIRGGKFRAVWVEERGLWSTNEYDVLAIIDGELRQFTERYNNEAAMPGEIVCTLYIRETENGIIDRWHKYVEKQHLGYYRPLDQTLVFANDTPKKTDYATKRLPYSLAKADTPAYDELLTKLYAPEERHKLEWAIGSIIAGDSVNLQKFVALYGAGGTGKSTVLKIIKKLFGGDEIETPDPRDRYWAVFDAKALGSGGSSGDFSLAAFRNDPLVAIQDDAKLDKIEDNTKFNALIAHESILVNEKNTQQYENSFRAFLFVGTNTPVKITDAKSGLIRRLIDISPTGEKFSYAKYRKLMDQIEFELGGIAWHCREVYLENPRAYDSYTPRNMIAATNDFYNFVSEYYFVFKENDGTTLTAAWKLYKDYIEDANLQDRLGKTKFGLELKNYFHEFHERTAPMEDGKRLRSYYSGFRYDIFNQPDTNAELPVDKSDTMTLEKFGFGKFKSAFDAIAANYPAQYGNDAGKPINKWANVTTTLKDLDTSKLHYVRVPENHIVIDFDIPDDHGEKSLERNLEEAAKWPETYAELSKSGKGIHLHYIYDGDPTKLADTQAPHVEIKVFTGNSSLRRMLTLCTQAEIRHLGSGLPLKGEKPPMIATNMIRSEQGIRKQIQRNLAREIHANTKPSIDMITKILDDAYSSGVKYDVSDMRNAVFGFAASSHNQRDYCMKAVAKMKFKSEQQMEQTDGSELPLVFFDCEVYPNLFVICWKYAGDDQEVHPMINPKPELVEDLIDGSRLVGFNNRKYDNHIVYARATGVSIEGLYTLSNSIIQHKKGFIKAAYDISETDIYDFSSKKQSLKKFEIELGIDHLEMDIPWDQPVPPEKWQKVVEYCSNDVRATEKVYEARRADFAGRQILAKLAGGTVNDTTNSLSARFIFQGDKNPQSQFNYRFMGDTSSGVYRSKADDSSDVIFNNFGDEYTVFDEQGRPVFPGYTFEAEEVPGPEGVPTKIYKSIYRGEEVGEGGYVYAEPGIYTDVALLDIESMHPHSAIAEQLFGEYYTARFKEIVDARLAIKHKDIEKARTLLNGELAPYLDDPELLKGLKQALKIVINSVYGLTSAKFMNPFRDERNVDNIVAKRGALFMINLKHEVQERGFTVAHIKTDSIKIPNATPEIIKFVQDYGEQYGYHFLHEATYERMCLVNDAVYIAKYADSDWSMQRYGYIPVDLEDEAGKWTATGTQFAVPYVFKTLFTKEPIIFDDLCETKSVTSALYLDMNEDLPDGEHLYHFVGRVGRFCPIKPGCGGGELLRQTENKKTGEKGFAAATGTKGWRWMESATVKLNGDESTIDRGYYDRLVDDALDAIAKYGDPTQFCSEEQLYSDFPPDDRPPWDFAEPCDIFDKR